MDADETRVDGNAIGGLLLELFGTEMTVATAVCASCGVHDLVACAQVYMPSGGPGTVVRCSHCLSVLMRVTRAPATERVWLDLSGVRSLELRLPG
jgi:hypothetical protein